MPLQCTYDPIIIIGMGRSGTTLMASLLWQMGLFLGDAFAEDLEARYFHGVNRTILKNAHGYWDNPAPMRYFLRNNAAVEETASCMERDLLSWRASQYLGMKRYLKYGSIQAFSIPWGWKDPQTVFTLPLWLRLFPRAKIIYVVRNGIDVASSLVKMEERVVERRRARSQRGFIRLKLQTRLGLYGFKGSARSLTLDGAFSLWEEYVGQAEETLSNIGNPQRVVKFEDLLVDPKTHLMDLREFCGLDTAERELQAIARQAHGERAHAFLRSPELKAFYGAMKNRRWMVHYRYAELTS